MDFNRDDDAGRVLRTPDDACDILMDEVISLAKSEPRSPPEKIALLFSAMVSLTLKTVRYARQQHPDAPVEEVSESTARALQMLTAAACCAACEAFEYSTDQVVRDLQSASSNHCNN